MKPASGAAVAWAPKPLLELLEALPEASVAVLVESAGTTVEPVVVTKVELPLTAVETRGWVTDEVPAPATGVPLMPETVVSPMLVDVAEPALLVKIVVKEPVERGVAETEGLVGVAPALPPAPAPVPEIVLWKVDVMTEPPLVIVVTTWVTTGLPAAPPVPEATAVGTSSTGGGVTPASWHCFSNQAIACLAPSISGPAQAWAEQSRTP